MEQELTAQQILDSLEPQINALIVAASQYKVIVTGFIYGVDPPLMMHIGNFNPSEVPLTLTQLHAKLATFFDNENKNGKVQFKDISKIDFTN